MILEHHVRRINRIIASDPQTAAEFGEWLAHVHHKYTQGIPLTCRELLRLSQSCLALVGREVTAP
jgi:hypothetical protein